MLKRRDYSFHGLLEHASMKELPLFSDLGEERAEYGKRVIEDLSRRLTERYGQGYSARNLHWFRQFYLAYSERDIIPHPAGTELPQGFSSQLSWSHCRALMRVENQEARDFYEREAIAGGWDKRTLERQIQSYYYERILKSREPENMLNDGRNLPVPAIPAADALKNPYVLEFLGLPNMVAFHESDLERAIITHLQRFLLELGNGFASKYMLCLPPEEQLQREVEKDRRLIEAMKEENTDE